jgi:predicted esterase YcpF (UPF0227 family)
MESLKSSDVKNLLKLSYEKGLVSYKKYKIDRSLSGQRVKVYYNDDLKKAVIVHRGTQTVQDVVVEVKSALGNDDTTRIHYSQYIQDKTVSKNGKYNIISLGHSLGAHINTIVSPEDQDQVNLNRPVMPKELIMSKKKGQKQVDIYHQYDPVSLLQHFEKKNGKEITVVDDSSRLNVLQNHSTDVLDSVHKVDYSASGSGIRPRRAKGSNAWLVHVKKYQEANKCSYKVAMKEAKASYQT